MAELAQVPILSASQSRNKAVATGLSVAGRVLALLVLLVGAVSFVFPLVWMLSTSLKADSEVFALPPIWIPAALQRKRFSAASIKQPIVTAHISLATTCPTCRPPRPYNARCSTDRGSPPRSPEV